MGHNHDQQNEQHDPAADEIDDKYSDVDPDDVIEDGMDYFSGQPRTETEKETNDDTSR